jgi:DNA-binding transcriptional LysR family regulator
VLREVAYAREAVYELSATLTGTLKLHVTPGTGNQIVIPALIAFLKEHPPLSAEIMVRPEPLDLLQAGVVLAISAGDQNDKGFLQTSVECRTLAPLRHVCEYARNVTPPRTWIAGWRWRAPRPSAKARSTGTLQNPRPDDRRLDMHVAQKINGQQAIDAVAVEAGRPNPGSSCRRAGNRRRSVA